MCCGRLTPDIISYNTAISACAKAGLPEEALRLLDEIERVSQGHAHVDAQSMAMREEDMVALQNTYAILVCVLSGRV